VHQFADQGIDLAQSQLGTALEIATHKTVLVHTHLESSCASILHRRSSELLGQREHAEHPADAGLSQLGINKVAECADMRAGSTGPPK